MDYRCFIYVLIVELALMRLLWKSLNFYLYIIPSNGSIDLVAFGVNDAQLRERKDSQC